MSKNPILLSEEVIQKRVIELAEEVKKDNTSSYFVLLGVLTGSYMFVTDLSKALWNTGIYNFTVDFIGISSYENNTTSSKDPIITKEPKELTGKHIIVVEDIVDTGWSLSFLKKYLIQHNAASIKVCALLSKPSRRETQIDIDYLGFEIPDKWVEGYGMDTAGLGRGNPNIIEKLEK